jgi:hypothetical protein
MLLLAAALLVGCSEPPSRTSAAPAAPADQAPRLAFPLACTIGLSCEVQHYVDDDPGPGVRDYHGGRRTYDGHNGVDIRIADMAQEKIGVDVLAAAPGRVTRLRDGVADISIRAPGAPDVKGRECGNGVVVDHGGGWETQYCHLAQGSVKVRVGDTVTAGQPIARVGLSGDTEFPHLHITVRHAGVVVDPFGPDPATSGVRRPLWTAAAAKVMAYKPGAVLNVGFASGPVTMDAVEAGAAPPPTADSALVAYARAIELEAGDELDLSLLSPEGAVLAQSRAPPLDHDKAQWLLFVGKKRPATGWPSGTYTGRFLVRRGGKVVISRDFDIRI